MPSADINGIKLFYETNGVGYPIIFCHEFAGDYRSWDLQVGYFSRKYNVITYSARGYFPSEVPSEVSAYSQEQSVKDLKGLMDFLSIEKAHIVGLSMGGNVAINFGLTYPNMASSIVAAGTGTGSDDPEVFRKRIISMAEGMRKEGMGFMENYVSGPARVQLQKKSPKAYNLFKTQFMEHSSIGSANTFEGVLSKRPPIFELKDKFNSVTIPVLIMTGDEDDPCINPSLFMKKHITTSGLIVFPRSGHAINLEDPAFFNSTVSDFLGMTEQDRWNPRDYGQGSGSLT
jgi:pimeloyl-ACP methyl ester carboxylesterase